LFFTDSCYADYITRYRVLYRSLQDMLNGRDLFTEIIYAERGI
jgi:hypothetical protein